jgi:hypothetical protein
MDYSLTCSCVIFVYESCYMVLLVFCKKFDVFVKYLESIEALRGAGTVFLIIGILH